MAGSCWCHCYEVYLVDILIMIFEGIVMMMIKEKGNKRVLKALEKCRKEFVVLRYSYFHCYCFYFFCLFIITLAIVVVTVISVVVAGTFIVVAVVSVVTFVNAIIVITVIVIIVILVIPLLH